MNREIEVICPTCNKRRVIVTSRNISEKICLSCSKKVDRNIINYFDNINTCDKAYIFGFLWADAWVGKYAIRIELKKSDEDILKFIQSQMGYGTISYRTRNDKRFKRQTESCTLTINSSYLCKKLREILFRVSIKFIPSYFRLDFLRGFLDGDGTIIANEKHKKFAVSFSSNNTENWDHIKEILDGQINYSISYNKSCSNLRLNGTDLEKINFLKKIYSTGSFHLSRKRDKIQEYESYKNPRKIGQSKSAIRRRKLKGIL